MRTWADDFNTYEEACIFYGCDTPAQIKAEIEDEAERHREMERVFGPYVAPPFIFNELPF